MNQEETKIEVSCEMSVMLKIIQLAVENGLAINDDETTEEAYHRACRHGLGPDVPYFYEESEEISPWVFGFEGFGLTLEARNPKIEKHWVSISGSIHLGYWDFGCYYGLDPDGSVVMFTVLSPHIIITERPDYPR